MIDLPHSVADLVNVLAAMPGAVAVALGGSRALGTGEAGSDWDLGLYYRGTIDLAPLTARGTVHPPGAWGRLMNGGAWLRCGGEKVDVPPARHGVGVQESQATFLTILKPAAPGAEPRLLLGHGEGATVSLDQARKAVADGVKDGRRKVILQADGDVPHGEVLKVATAVTEVEGVTVHVGVQEPHGGG